ncbi:MAG: FkbM family methyltransferase [Segetibacter sp.]|nr:FkbM family methyltransferase [Segetibacter sp.]
MHFYSQDGQDKCMVELCNGMRGGFFLDVGAFDGVALSNTFYLEKNLGWAGICIEPNPNVFELLKVNRKCTCLNCCISDKRETVKFLSVSGWGVMLSGMVDMYDQRHIERIDQTIREHGGDKRIVDIPAMPLSEILEDRKIKKIDYCNIDVEGGEMNVLNSINLNNIYIRFFTIENAYGSPAIRKYLKRYGYSMIKILGADEVYEKNSKRYGMMIKLKVSLLIKYFQHLKQKLKIALKSDK